MWLYCNKPSFSFIHQSTNISMNTKNPVMKFLVSKVGLEHQCVRHVKSVHMLRKLNPLRKAVKCDWKLWKKLVSGPFFSNWSKLVLTELSCSVLILDLDKMLIFCCSYSQILNSTENIPSVLMQELFPDINMWSILFGNQADLQDMECHIDALSVAVPNWIQCYDCIACKTAVRCNLKNHASPALK